MYIHTVSEEWWKIFFQRNRSCTRNAFCCCISLPSSSNRAGRGWRMGSERTQPRFSKRRGKFPWLSFFHLNFYKLDFRDESWQIGYAKVLVYSRLKLIQWGFRQQDQHNKANALSWLSVESWWNLNSKSTRFEGINVKKKNCTWDESPECRVESLLHKSSFKSGN